MRAFDVAARFQTPVPVCSDLDIGMNEWAVPELCWDDNLVADRGRLLSEDDLGPTEQFLGYDDPDACSVTPSTLPGADEKAACFARGSGQPGAHAAWLRGRTVDAVRWVRPRLDHSSSHPGPLGALGAAAL